MASAHNWKLYIINLERAPVRRKFIQNQLDKLRITNYEFIDAVDGMKVGDAWLNEQVDQEQLVRPLRPTEIACAISHRMALDHFVAEGNTQYAVILEDDVLLPKNTKELLDNLVRLVSGDEVVLLSASLHTQQQFKKLHSITPGTDLLQATKPIEQVYIAAAYMVSRDVAKTLSRAVFPVTDVADSWRYYKERGGMREILLAFPYPIVQEVFQSTRGNKAMIYDAINWVLLNKVPGLYQFFSERRNRDENQRRKNVVITEEK